MEPELKIRTSVQAGGRIEFEAPDLAVGQSVEITVRPLKPHRHSILDILADSPGGVLFRTAEDVDRYIREERDSWDR